MNEKVNDILHILDKEDNPSQREIAKKTGISLGLVNTLIKKCAKKGLVKIERLNSRNIKYILTPNGVKEITKKTISYVERSYKAIQRIQSEVKELARKHSKEGKSIYLLKEENNEVFRLINNTLNDMSINYEVIEKIDGFNGDKEIVVYHWNPELEVVDQDLELVNIFRS